MFIVFIVHTATHVVLFLIEVGSAADEGKLKLGNLSLNFQFVFNLVKFYLGFRRVKSSRHPQQSRISWSKWDPKEITSSLSSFLSSTGLTEGSE